MVGPREERFEALAGQVVDPLRRYLARRASADLVDDLLAETLVVCWRRLDEVPSEPLPWAYGVARNLLANARRAEARRQRLDARLAAEPPPLGPVDADPDGRLAAALAALPVEQAELLRLWAWERLERREIAVVLGTSANAVSLRLRRAQDALGRTLADPAGAARQDRGPAGHEQGERRRS
ncbi:sigma-70 family RNA polymerase sigma factor [Nocardioides sp. TRM66260-LWL]|uniref:RNA polymerase sigma factor n=1 Tax=Nocardioides sp. TRM66260-LWL TaxID=2874478 RepID=UPI001CC79122|nr:sigma-70 family RNA polymerase sigma factor [Nocardioides sp. TRM66260-LWL]MBZ5734584.1 sigma-70 family RNA polymerase sigma factor [Nocardioides sp. TRM66260-LWL]